MTARGLNQVLLVHVDPAKLSGSEQSHAADGIVAFSATCTHQRCPVTGWLTTSQHLQCPCHQSEYDPLQNCKVVAGPAPRPLPPLPLAMVNGELQVAGPFIGRVGGRRPAWDSGRRAVAVWALPGPDLGPPLRLADGPILVGTHST